jgi:hypothetical protein
MENESKQLNEQAQELMQEERWIDAIKLIESQPSLFERHAELSWNLGWAYCKLENWKAAQVPFVSRSRSEPEVSGSLVERLVQLRWTVFWMKPKAMLKRLCGYRSRQMLEERLALILMQAESWAKLSRFISVV